MTWKWEALKTISELAERQATLTSDDLHAAPVDPAEPNQMGAVFREAHQMGVIQPTGRIVKSARGPSKGRAIQVWERCPSMRLPL